MGPDLVPRLLAHRERRLALALLGLAAAGSLAVAGIAGRLSPLPLLAVLASLLALIVGLRWGETTVLAILVAALAVRVSLPTGTESAIVASLLLSAAALPVWAWRLWRSPGGLRLQAATVNLPLLGFIAAALFSYLWGNLTFDPLVRTWPSWPLVQLASLATLLLLPLTFLLAANIIADVRWLQAATGLMIGVGFLAALPGAGRILNHRGLFPLWFVCLGLGQALFNRRLPAAVRGLLLGGVLVWLTVVSIAWTGWLSGWVPPLAGVLVLSARRRLRLLVAVLLILAVILAGFWPRFREIVEENRRVSGETRLAAWSNNWQLTRTHLLFGLGPAAYAAYYRTYTPQHTTATHNNYLDILSQTGLVGLFFFLWFFFALGLVAFRLSRRLRRRGDFAEGYAAAALAGWTGAMVAMVLGDWLIPFAYTQTIGGYDYAVYSWIFLGGLIALDRLSG